MPDRGYTQTHLYIFVCIYVSRMNHMYLIRERQLAKMVEGNAFREMIQ